LQVATPPPSEKIATPPTSQTIPSESVTESAPIEESPSPSPDAVRESSAEPVFEKPATPSPPATPPTMGLLQPTASPVVAHAPVVTTVTSLEDFVPAQETTFEALDGNAEAPSSILSFSGSDDTTASSFIGST